MPRRKKHKTPTTPKKPAKGTFSNIPRMSNKGKQPMAKRQKLDVSPDISSILKIMNDWRKEMQDERKEIRKEMQDERKEMRKEMQDERKVIIDEQQEIRKEIREMGNRFHHLVPWNAGEPSSSSGSYAGELLAGQNSRRASTKQRKRKHLLSPTQSTLGIRGVYEDSEARSNTTSSCLVDLAMLNSNHGLDVKLLTISDGLKYTQQQMFQKFNFSFVKEKKFIAPLIIGKSYSEAPNLLFFLNIIKQSDTLLYAYLTQETSWSVCCAPNFEKIRPFISSLNIKSDCLGERIIGETAVAWLILETHSGTSSSSYLNSVCKTASNVVDMFRNLRLFYPTLQSIAGFTFPKEDFKECVTKVEVSFNVTKLKFEIQAKNIELCNVKEELLSYARSMQEFMNSADFDCSPDSNWLRLNQSDITLIESTLKARELKQVRSATSILVSNEEYFWKANSELSVTHAHQLLEQCSTSPHVVEANLVHYFWLQFPRLIDPLGRLEISLCLADFLQLVKVAMESLHQCGFAHHDIRIPNVCFKEQGSDILAVFIDLDRARPVDEVAESIYQGEMYTKETSSWTFGQLDYKQLGLACQAVHNISQPPSRFITTLIKSGKWGEVADYEELQSSYSSTVATLLTSRNK